jgi:peptidoglycan/xylan/chitin deacetylase (PgdA/CDA1 family)
LEYVNQNFQVIPLERLLHGNFGPTPVAAITFDDGWRDNYDVAFPILCDLRMVATVFVTTGKIGSREPFWQQQLGELFRRAHGQPQAAIGQQVRTALGLGDHEPLTPRLYRRTVQRWKGLEPMQREEYLDAAGRLASPPTISQRLFLTPGEIREMAGQRMTFGSHTVNHVILTRQPIRVVNQELRESKATLETLLDADVDMLAYPNGDLSDAVVDCAKGLGYRIACATGARRVRPRDDAMRLPRIEPEWDFPDGAAAGFSDTTFQWRAR